MTDVPYFSDPRRQVDVGDLSPEAIRDKLAQRELELLIEDDDEGQGPQV